MLEPNVVLSLPGQRTRVEGSLETHRKPTENTITERNVPREHPRLFSTAAHRFVSRRQARPTRVRDGGRKDERERKRGHTGLEGRAGERGKKGCRIQKWRVVRGIWGGTSPERFIPPRGSRGESLLKMTGRPSHGDLQENCSFVKISTCVLACDLINCLLVSWLPVPSSRVEPVYLRAIADRITPFLELAFHFFYPGNYLQHYCSASASAPVIIEKFLFCGLYLDLFVPKTSASSFRRGFDASVSHSQCGCE